MAEHTTPERPRELGRRRLDEVFGDVVPETTSDERDPRASGSAGHSSNDEWYLENRPPHHDR